MLSGFDVVFTPEFETDLKTLFGSTAEGDEYVHGLDWRLSRDPTKGTPLDKDKRIWTILSRKPHKLGSVFVFYTFNEDTVFLLAIKAIEGPKS